MFVSVCQAIQHAHQKGIIHRDVKPSNVLVTLYDGNPVPKVIDFGIAKATQQKLTERTMFTGIGQILGTFEYMSPEQAEMNQMDIDTRSDVYSLGVMLYELLTGTTPIKKQSLRNVGVEKMLRTIRETDPPRPSNRLSESRETLTSISAARRTDPARLSKLLRGDLDWIVMKALEKDRTRRYGSANELAADVQRFLQGELVTACPPSPGYRLRKFAKRNLSAIVTGCLIAVSLLVATATSTWQAFEAQKSRKIAQDNFERAINVVNDFFVDVSIDPSLLGERSGMFELRHKLLSKSHGYLEQLVEENPENEAVTLMWCKMIPHYAQSLRHVDEQDKGTELLEKGVTASNSLLVSAPDSLDVKRTRGLIHARLGFFNGNRRELLAVIEMLRDVLEDKPDDMQVRVTLGNALQWAARAIQYSNSEKAMQEVEESIAILSACGVDGVKPLSEGYCMLGEIRGGTDYVTLAQRAVDVLNPLPFNHPGRADNLGRSWKHVADAHQLLGQYEEAEVAMKESVQLFEEFVRNDPGNAMRYGFLLRLYGSVATLYIKQCRFEDAERVLLKAETKSNLWHHNGQKKYYSLNAIAWPIVSTGLEGCESKPTTIIDIAIRMATQACELSKWRQAYVVDTLAAATLTEEISNRLSNTRTKQFRSLYMAAKMRECGNG